MLPASPASSQALTWNLNTVFMREWNTSSRKISSTPSNMAAANAPTPTVNPIAGSTRSSTPGQGTSSTTSANNSPSVGSPSTASARPPTAPAPACVHPRRSPTHQRTNTPSAPSSTTAQPNSTSSDPNGVRGVTSPSPSGGPLYPTKYGAN